MRVCILFLFNLSVSFFSYAQNILPDKVRVQCDDQNIVASIRPFKSEVQTAPEKYYHWYASGKLQVTQGGFSGKLLNGPYESFYLNKSIKEQGVFKKGLKLGDWKSWYENGNLQEVASWKSGKKTGAFCEYKEDGKQKRWGKYRNGVLHGKLFFYSAKDSLLVQHYRKGLLIPEKVKKESNASNFFRKIISGTKKMSKRLLKKHKKGVDKDLKKK